MHKQTARIQRRALWGWVKWVPVVVIPFSILFFHAWINIQILRADYVLRELNAEARDLSDRLNQTGTAETIHEDPEVLATRAALLDFIQPEPGQREIISYNPASLVPHPEDGGFAVARLDGLSSSEAAPEQAASDPVPTPAATPPTASAGPVLLEIETSLESISPPAASGTAPDEVDGVAEDVVVLDLPDQTFVEKPANLLDAGMGSLESL